jgi:hypothetical protein
MSIPHALPSGWIIATDPSTGKTYFANPASGETSWVPPPPPPPRQPTKIPPQSNIASSSYDDRISNPSNFPVLAANKSIKEAKESDIEPMEINLTGGMISDLVKAQFIHRRQPNQTFHMSYTNFNQKQEERYIPLNLAELPELFSLPHQEKVRIETRILSLKEALSKI